MEDEEDKSISLTGFLFGNIDTKGDLDEDFLDEVRNFHFVLSVLDVMLLARLFL